MNTGTSTRAWAAAGLSNLSRAFRHRNYRLFFAGQGTSLIGTWMQSVAQSWLVYRLTGSAALLGLVGFCGNIPIFLMSPLGGALADKLDRRAIMIGTQISAMVLALVLSFLTFTDTVKIWHVFLLASLLGATNAFDVPARQAFVIDLVGKEDLLNAIALNSSMFNGARIVGPAVAGALVALVGEGWCFLLNGVSYLAVIAGLLLMRMPPRAPRSIRGSTLARIREGFGFAARTGPLRALLLLLGLSSLCAMPYVVLMPIFADRILYGGPSGMGLLMGCSGIGALSGALTLAARTEAKGLGRWVHLAAIGFGLSLVLFALSRSFWLSAALLVPVGFCMIVSIAASNTLLQIMTPDDMRGRIMAIYSMMMLGMAPFGALLAGVLAHFLGAPVTVVIGGATCAAGAVVFGLKLPALREEARSLLQAQERAAGAVPADPAQPQNRKKE